MNGKIDRSEVVSSCDNKMPKIWLFPPKMANKKVTQNCNTCEGKFMDGKISTPKGAKQGGM
jgi:hypothetical protein